MKSRTLSRADFVGGGGAFAHDVNSAMDVGVTGFVIRTHGVDDLARLLAAGCGVQEDQPLAGWTS